MYSCLVKFLPGCQTVVHKVSFIVGSNCNHLKEGFVDSDDISLIFAFVKALYIHLD